MTNTELRERALAAQTHPERFGMEFLGIDIPATILRLLDENATLEQQLRSTTGERDLHEDTLVRMKVENAALVKERDDYSRHIGILHKTTQFNESLLRAENARLLKRIEAQMDLIETAWGVIANAGEGDWTREHREWRDAAARWRGRYHAALVPDDAMTEESTIAADPPERGSAIFMSDSFKKGDKLP